MYAAEVNLPAVFNHRVMKKIILRSIFVLFLSPILLHAQTARSYLLIPKKTGKINKAVVSTLPPSLRALAAFYSAMGGTQCAELQCELTTALKLGKQGSDEQKSLIQKYFPGDKAATLVVGQDCYLPPSGSSSFSNFQFLDFNVKGDSVQVNYELDVFDHGTTKKINGPDIYIFRSQVFKNKKRVLYGWTNK